MELNMFIRELEASLVRHGINPEVANKHANTLLRTFTEDDLNEIRQLQSKAEVDDIAGSIALLLQKNKIRPAVQQPEPDSHPARLNPPSYPVLNRQTSTSAQKPVQSPAKQAPRQPAYYEDHESEGDEYFAEYDVEEKTTKGFYTFWLSFILTLPITAALAVVFFGLFVGAFAALSLLIAGLITGLVCLVAAGAGVSLVGIIFGVTQLFSFPAAGVYEIGLGIMVIGVVMFAGILIYNIAIRFLPWVIRLVAALLKFSCGKIAELFQNIRRECYKL